MGLDTALTIAQSGLLNVQNQLALVSHNVANAGTPGYVSETLPQQAEFAGGQGMGVRTGLAIRTTDPELRAEVAAQVATVAFLQTRQTALAPIGAALGTPGGGRDLSSMLATLQGDFTMLANDPAATSQQAQVVSDAGALARGINALSATYTQAGQAAQNDVVAAVGTLDQSLATIGTLSDKIIAARAGGRSTADLENQRDLAVQNVSQLVDVRVLDQPNGDLLLMTAGGAVLPTHGNPAPLSIASATYAPGASPGSMPPILLGGVDVTSAFTGGQIGADLALRDSTLPTYQAELDSFAQTLAGRFDAQGLTLFTDARGAVPASAGGAIPQAGYAGFSAEIQVNAAVQNNPTLVRDGTHAVAGSAAGASAFTPNPTGAAGFTDMIQRVLDFTFGADIQANVPQSPPDTTRLGIGGNLQAPFAAPATLTEFAGSVIGAQSQDMAANEAALGDANGLQKTLNGKLQSEESVNIDSEMAHMVQLQNAYGANARIVAAVQSMWNALVGSVQPGVA